MKLNFIVILLIILSVLFFTGCTTTPVIVSKAESEILNVRKSTIQPQVTEHASLGSERTEPVYPAAAPISIEAVQSIKPSAVYKPNKISTSEAIPASVPQISLNSRNKKRLALIIGNASYKKMGASLRNPINDAQSMKNALNDLDFTVIKYENVVQKDMKKAIDYFGKKLTNYDVGLFFYAGHGIQVNGNNYLIPTDAELNTKNDVEYNCVRADRILAKMEDSGSKTNIIIMDACRNNPFKRSWTRSARGIGGLAFMNAPTGSLIAYATAPGNTAEDGNGRNGTYTSALLKHIKSPGITIVEMFQRVRREVIATTGKRQTPWESTSLVGNFYFYRRK